MTVIEVTLMIGGQPLVAELGDAALAAIASALPRVEEPTYSPWLTVSAAAVYLGLSEHAARKFIDRHQVEKHQHCKGGRILVHRDDLYALLTEGRTP